MTEGLKPNYTIPNYELEEIFDDYLIKIFGKEVVWSFNQNITLTIEGFLDGSKIDTEMLDEE